VVLFVLFREEPLPEERPSTGDCLSHGRLPAAYWLLAFLVATAGAIEFCVVFYAAQLLHAVDGLSTATAASALGLQYSGILTGRVLGSRSTQRSGRAFPLILAALAVTATGFFAFWALCDARVAALGLLYRMGARGLQIYALKSFGIEMSCEEATLYRKRFFQA